MRRRNQEITVPQELESIIARAPVCRIGMSDGRQPYVVPVCFGYEPGALYFHSATEGKKLDLLREHPHVCFELETDVEIVRAEQPCGWTVHYRSVIGFGRATILTSADDKRRALAAIMRHYGFQGADGSEAIDFPAATMDRTAVIRIEIESMTGKQSGHGSG
jgi:nitroimidazol reductase NimA-like FMN-containing flavoprotein (pyridoxamine 5'-phosphate oxidase superfamily)